MGYSFILEWASKAWAKIAIIGAILAGLFLVFFKIRQSGKDAATNAGLKQGLEHAKQANEIKADIAKLPAGDSAKRLRDKWNRD